MADLDPGSRAYAPTSMWCHSTGQRLQTEKQLLPVTSRQARGTGQNSLSTLWRWGTDTLAPGCTQQSQILGSQIEEKREGFGGHKKQVFLFCREETCTFRDVTFLDIFFAQIHMHFDLELAFSPAWTGACLERSHSLSTFTAFSRVPAMLGHHLIPHSPKVHLQRKSSLPINEPE